jgi:hypothetical protein
MDLTEVVADLGFILSTWWSKSESRPEIANSDRSFWGMLHVRHRGIAYFASIAGDQHDLIVC